MFEKNIVGGGGLRGVVKRGRGPILAAALLAGGGNALAQGGSGAEDVQRGMAEVTTPAECTSDVPDTLGNAKNCGLNISAWEEYRASVVNRLIHASDDQVGNLGRLLADIDAQMKSAKDVQGVRSARPGNEASLDEWIAYGERIAAVFKDWDAWENKKGSRPPLIYKLMTDEREVAEIIERMRQAEALRALQDTARAAAAKLPDTKE